jgi:acyl-CoA thioester hydrolase
MAAEDVTMIARRQRIEYLQQAVLGDELELATWLADVEHSSAVRHVTLSRVRDGVLVAQAYTLWEWVSVATGRPARIPTALIGDSAPD